jgi:hypothetical protein
MAIDLDKVRAERLKGFSSEKATADLKIGSIIDDLASVGEQMSEHFPRISESLFVRSFLVPFYGAGQTQESNYASYLSWITDVAGNYNMPVHVCDDRTKEILFTVPAVSNVQTINPAKAQTREINSAVSMANDARFLQPHNWEAMLQDNLYGVFKKVYDADGIPNNDQKAWLDIFTRYKDILKDKKQIINDKTLMANNQNTNEQKPSSTPSFDEVDDPV